MTGLIARFAPYALAFLSSLCIMTLELVASRLVARHVGASLHVWTSVIGIVLGGICLGNVLGGRLSDRFDPRKAVGVLFAAGAALTLACLWINAYVGFTPGLDQLPWSLRTLLVVSLNFLVPATVIGMIGPVVAKIAVDQSRKAGSAIGDVYFWGAVGSIAGTFLAGFVLMYQAPTSTIVNLVGAGLILLAALTLPTFPTRMMAFASALFLAIGTLDLVDAAIPTGIQLGSARVNLVLLVGHLLAVLTAVLAIRLMPGARLPVAQQPEPMGEEIPAERTTLGDLALLAFLISLAFMALEMVAGRLVTRHLGSSIYGWTSVIGVLLGGLSLGNWLGGKIADRVTSQKQASWLFLVASIFTLWVILAESPPKAIFGDMAEEGSLLSRAIIMSGFPWSMRVLIVVALVFFLPAITMGTVSPVVAKLAIDRLRSQNRTGTAIGQVYAWGMVGSILGTFLAGFLLIDVLGTKGLVLVLATTLAIASTALGSVWHAAWAGIPLGLCILAFAPVDWLREQGVTWGVREETGDPNTDDDALALVDESNYYYIKVINENVLSPDNPEDGGFIKKRTLVLDNLIHGYFLLGHPEHIEYDYEYIYAQVAWRVAQAKAKAAGVNPQAVPLHSLFLGGGSYTFPRYLQHVYENAECDVAEIDPAVTRANHVALGLPMDTSIKTHWGDARQFVQKEIAAGNAGKYDLVFGDAFNDFSVPWHLTTQEFNEKIADLLTENGVYMINIIDVYRSDETALRDAIVEGQIEAIAAALRESGNDHAGSDSLARGLRTAWRDENLALDVDRVGDLVTTTLEDLPSARQATIEELKLAFADSLARVEKPFRGESARMVDLAVDTLARAQFQRDQAAASEAISDFLRDRKLAAARTAFQNAGIRLKAASLADRIVDNWFGGQEAMLSLLEQLNVEGDVGPLAESLVRAMNSAEAEIKETPQLLARRLILSANEMSVTPDDQIRTERQAPAILEKLRSAGITANMDELARRVADRLEADRIQGGFRELARRAEQAARDFGSNPDRMATAAAMGVEKARGLGAFLGSWVETARKTFPEVDIFGTDSVPGSGLRETFVVVASKQPLDLGGLGTREGDPRFIQDDMNFEPRPYSASHQDALQIRARGIILTDDYAPVENLLAPVAATRADD